MDIKIVDSTGTEKGLKISNKNRAQVDATTKTLATDASIEGKAYNINTGTITLTSANKSALLYVKNNEDKDMIIDEILLIIGASTGGSGSGEVSISSNPTGGTIISGATEVEIKANRNFGSSRVLDADCFKGAEASTCTGHSLFAESSRSSFPTVISFDGGNVVIPKGSSMCVEFTPPTGNTSMEIKTAVILYIN